MGWAGLGRRDDAGNGRGRDRWVDLRDAVMPGMSKATSSRKAAHACVALSHQGLEGACAVMRVRASRHSVVELPSEGRVTFVCCRGPMMKVAFAGYLQKSKAMLKVLASAAKVSAIRPLRLEASDHGRLRSSHEGEGASRRRVRPFMQQPFPQICRADAPCALRPALRTR